MAQFVPVKGKFCKAEFGATVLTGINWSLNLDPKGEDVSNFRDGRARDGTLDDATGSLTLIEDDENSILADTAIQIGQFGILKLYTDNAQTKFYSLPVMITNAGPKVEDQEKHLKCDIQFGLSGYWNGTTWVAGVITHPTADA
jgi:hypothetical protein